LWDFIVLPETLLPFGIGFPFLSIADHAAQIEDAFRCAAQLAYAV
jgi:hypothetical protein